MSKFKLPFGASVVASAFACQALALGLGAGVYPVFMAFLEADYGISRAQSSLGLPILFISGALVSPLIGAQVDRGSPRVIMCLGAVVMGMGLALLSLVQSLAVLVVVWAMLVGVGHAMLGILPATSVVNNWFEVRRSTMVAVAATGITAGMAVGPLVAQGLIDLLGWRQALLGLAAICVSLAVPIILLGIVKRPQDAGLEVDGVSSSVELPSSEPIKEQADQSVNTKVPVFSDRRFWLMAGTFAIMGGLALAFTTHVVGWAEETGFERRAAVMLLSIAAVSAATGKLSFGYLCDRIGLRKALWVGVIAQVMGWSLMLLAEQQWLFIVGAMCYAFGTGAIVPLQAAAISKLWGAANFGRVLGCTGLVAISCIFLTPTLLGVAYEQTGGYDWPMLVVLPLVLVPGLLFSALQLAPTPKLGSSVGSSCTG